MNRVIITMISIIVIIAAIFTAIAIFMPNYNQKGENIKTEVAEEEILDDCTDEYEGMEYENTVKANTQEEKHHLIVRLLQKHTIKNVDIPKVNMLIYHKS